MKYIQLNSKNEKKTSLNKPCGVNNLNVLNILVPLGWRSNCEVHHF